MKIARLAGWGLALILVAGLAARVAASAGDDPVAGAVDARGFKFARVDAKSGEPVRFDPCAPLHYVVNPASAPDGAIEDIHKAFEMTGTATGIRFVYDGLTDEPLDIERNTFQPGRYGDRWAPVLVGWMSDLPDTGHPETEGAARIGLGGSSLVRDGSGPAVLVSGLAFFDSDADILPGFGGATWGQTMLHEIGHVVGLDHVENEASIMNPRMGPRPASWGEGDRAGLWELGIGSKCLQVPDPQ